MKRRLVFGQIDSDANVVDIFKGRTNCGSPLRVFTDGAFTYIAPEGNDDPKEVKVYFNRVINEYGSADDISTMLQDIGEMKYDLESGLYKKFHKNIHGTDIYHRLLSFTTNDGVFKNLIVGDAYQTRHLGSYDECFDGYRSFIYHDKNDWEFVYISPKKEIFVLEECKVICNMGDGIVALDKHSSPDTDDDYITVYDFKYNRVYEDLYGIIDRETYAHEFDNYDTEQYFYLYNGVKDSYGRKKYSRCSFAKDGVRGRELIIDYNKVSREDNEYSKPIQKSKIFT